MGLSTWHRAIVSMCMAGLVVVPYEYFRLAVALGVMVFTRVTGVGPA